MIIDGISIAPGSEIKNAYVESGETFPVSPSTGRLFYLTLASETYSPGLYTFDGTVWVTGDVSEIIVGTGLTGGGTSGVVTISIDTDVIPTLVQLNTHTSDEAIHLTSDQNTLLDSIDYVNVTSTKINYLSNVTSDIQAQLDAKTGDLTGHIGDEAIHLTSDQNTLLDGIDYVNMTPTKINYLSNVTSDIQAQLDTNSTNITTHTTDEAIHLTSDQNTLLDSIDYVNVTSTKINYLSNVTSDIQAQIDNKLPLTGGTISGNLSLLIEPSAPNHATTKQYVDGIVSGLDIKASVRVATTGSDITLIGTQTIDDVILSVGDRVLVKDQVGAETNGIYVVQETDWARAADADSTSGISTGTFVFVEEGTVNNASGWVLTTPNPINISTSLLTFSQFSGAGQIVAGSGMTKTGNQLDVVGTSGRIVANDDSIDLDVSGVVAGAYTKVTVDSYGRTTLGENPSTLSGYGITDAAPISHVGSGGTEHAVATQSVPGFMSAEDKTALDNASPNTHNHDTVYAPITVLYDEFAATENQTVFTFVNVVNIVGSHRLQVFVQGIKQPESAYVETTTDITLSSGVSAGTVVEVYFR